MNQYRLSFLIFILLAMLSRQSFSQGSVVTNVVNLPLGMIPIAFSNLDKIQTGPGLRVSWIRHNYNPLADGTTIDDKIFWNGSYDAYIVTNIQIQTNVKTHSKKTYSEVLGKKDEYWRTTESGIVDINMANGRAYYATEELTNVLTMGFGVHWNISSIKFSSRGKIYGKSKDLTDNLEGTIDYFPDGKMKDCFYLVPKLGFGFLLSYAYGDAQTNNGSSLNSISLSMAEPSDNGGFVKVMDDLKYEILDISEIKPEETALVGVPPPALYKYTLISNGITIPQGKPLTPEMIGASEAKTTNTVPKSNRQQMIIAMIIIMSTAILIAIVCKAKNSK